MQRYGAATDPVIDEKRMWHSRWNHWSTFCGESQRCSTSESCSAVRWNFEIHGVTMIPTHVSPLACLTVSQEQRGKAHTVPAHSGDRWRESTLNLLVAASNWSGISLGNCTFLSCWVCLDSEAVEDYSASSRRPRCCRETKHNIKLLLGPRSQQKTEWNAVEGGRIQDSRALI